MNISSLLNTIRHFCQRQSGLALAIATVGLMTACATGAGPQFSGVATPTADKGDVYLYRTDALSAGGADFLVSLNGTRIDPLVNASFLHLRLAPGSHTLKVEPGFMAKTSELPIEVKAASTSFYRYEFVTGILFNSFFIGSSIQAKDQATAVAEMKELRAVK